ncbi:MAG TPA: FAD-binding protein, partial [Thiobacillaceae bacterium]|nr:FAD-binding protein [Thiobacillaceae bacterium]
MILAERMMVDTPLPPPHIPPGIPGSQGELELGADMSQYTSWRVGGKVDRLYTPASLEDLAAFLASLDREEPVWFVGLGSNLLVRDGGLRGTVIHLHGTLRNLAIEQRRQNGWTGQDSGKFGVVYAEAGVASPKVARFAASHDLAGAEFLAGIPGTVGGALAMNAGCYGHDTWEFVSQVLTINRAGQINRRGPKDFQVAYRHVAPRDPREEWFVAAWFMFPRGDGSQAREEIKRLLDKRIATQP